MFWLMARIFTGKAPAYGRKKNPGHQGSTKWDLNDLLLHICMYTSFSKYGSQNEWIGKFQVNGWVVMATSLLPIRNAGTLYVTTLTTDVYSLTYVFFFSFSYLCAQNSRTVLKSQDLYSKTTVKLGKLVYSTGSPRLGEKKSSFGYSQPHSSHQRGRETHSLLPLSPLALFQIKMQSPGGITLH